MAENTPSTSPQDDYDYSNAGFDAFMDRSIDRVSESSNLDSQVYQSREMSYDSGASSGSLGDSLQIGNIKLDGKNGRISVFDDNGNETMRIGELDG